MGTRLDSHSFAQRAIELLGLRRLFGKAVQPGRLPGREEHRSEPRFTVYGFGTSSLGSGPKMIPIQVMDISLRGVQYRIQDPPKVGDQVLLRLQVPGCPPFEELACVRWVGTPAGGNDQWFPVGASLLESSHVL